MPASTTSAQERRTHRGGSSARRPRGGGRRSAQALPPHHRCRFPYDHPGRSRPHLGDAAAVPNPITSAQEGRTHRTGSSARRPLGWGCCCASARCEHRHHHCRRKRRGRQRPHLGDSAAVPASTTSAPEGRTHQGGSSARWPRGGGRRCAVACNRQPHRCSRASRQRRKRPLRWDTAAVPDSATPAQGGRARRVGASARRPHGGDRRCVPD